MLLKVAGEKSKNTLCCLSVNSWPVSECTLPVRPVTSPDFARPPPHPRLTQPLHHALRPLSADDPVCCFTEKRYRLKETFANSPRIHLTISTSVHGVSLPTPRCGRTTPAPNTKNQRQARGYSASPRLYQSLSSCPHPSPGPHPEPRSVTVLNGLWLGT